MECGLCLGTNQGERLAMLKQARDRLQALPEALMVAQSPVYETEPLGVQPQHAHLDFLNAVVIMESDRTPSRWLQAVRSIEAELGRRRGPDRYAPRTIDIDILYVGDRTVERADLVVPHPRWLQRAFVVCPLADVRPDLQLPECSQTVRQVLSGLETSGVARYCATW